jgi:hypothetical protein
MSPELFGPNPFVVRIDTPFRGINPGEKQVRLFLDLFRKGCSAPVKLGKRYLFYAVRRGQSDVMESSYCSGSFEITPQNERWIEELSKAAESSNPNFIYGDLRAIVKWPNSNAPLSRVELHFKSSNDEFRLWSDESGAYWAYNLPPGKYSVSASNDPRAALLGVPSSELPITEINIPKSGCVELSLPSPYGPRTIAQP